MVHLENLLREMLSRDLTLRLVTSAPEEGYQEFPSEGGYHPRLLTGGKWTPVVQGSWEVATYPRQSFRFAAPVPTAKVRGWVIERAGRFLWGDSLPTPFEAERAGDVLLLIPRVLLRAAPPA